MTVKEAELVNAFISRNGVKLFHPEGKETEKRKDGYKFDRVYDVEPAIPNIADNLNTKVYTLSEASLYLGITEESLIAHCNSRRIYYLKDKNRPTLGQSISYTFLLEHLETFLASINKG